MSLEQLQEIPDDMLLGHVSWFSVSNDPPIHFDHITKLMTDNGFDEKWMPSSPRPGDAYKRACRYSERTNVALPGTLNRANFMIRKVVTDPAIIQRDLVMEVVDKTDRQLSYEVCAKLIWKRDEEKLTVRMISLGVDKDPIVKETLKAFNDNFKAALENIDSQVIRLFIRKYLEHLGAVAVRPRGSLYFIPITKREEADALVAVIDGLNDGSSSHSIPLIDNTKQREMISHAFQDDIHEEAQQKLAELMTLKAKGEKISRGKWAAYQKDMKRLKERHAEYREFLGDELTRGKLEIKGLDSQLTDILTNDLVKE